VKKVYNTLSCFHRIPERSGQTDGHVQTDRFAINIARQCAHAQQKP